MNANTLPKFLCQIIFFKEKLSVETRPYTNLPVVNNVIIPPVDLICVEDNVTITSKELADIFLVQGHKVEVLDSPNLKEKTIFFNSFPVDPEIFARTSFSLILVNWLPREFKVIANKESL